MSDERQRPGVTSGELPGGLEHGEETMVLHAEEVTGVRKGWRGIGYVRARKRVQTSKVKEDLPYDVEDLDLERQPVAETDSGEIETLPDGSVSIPVYAEELVVTKRTVLKERVIIRKRTVTETMRIESELREEHVEIEADKGVEVRGDV